MLSGQGWTKDGVLHPGSGGLQVPRNCVSGEDRFASVTTPLVIDVSVR